MDTSHTTQSQSITREVVKGLGTLADVLDTFVEASRLELSCCWENMSYLFGRLVNGIKGYYSEINSATLTGAIDIIVVRRADGSFVGSPFHVRFGKIGVLRSREKIVSYDFTLVAKSWKNILKFVFKFVY